MPCFQAEIQHDDEQDAILLNLETVDEPPPDQVQLLVDQLYVESDKETVTKRDIYRSVASQLGIEELTKETKEIVKRRLKELVNGEGMYRYYYVI